MFGVLALEERISVLKLQFLRVSPLTVCGQIEEILPVCFFPLVSASLSIAIVAWLQD